MKTIAFICLCFINTCLHAQNIPYSFRHLDESNGLVSTLVTCIAQDSSGFMWIATANGLQRYDGYRFVTYRHDAGNAQTLSSNIIEQVIVDKYNNVFALTSDANIWLLNRDKNIFYKIASATHNSSNSVLSVSSSGELYITTYNCICRYNDKDNRLDTIVSINNYPNLFFSSAVIIDTIRRVAWAGTSKGLYYYDFAVKKLIACNAIESRFNIPFTYYVTGVFLSTNNSLWLSSYVFYISQYNFNSKNLYSYKLPQEANSINSAFVNGLCEDKMHRLWLATSNAGLLLYNSAKNNFQSFVYQPWNPQSVRYASDINHVFTDKQGNLWISADRGISYFNPSNNLFKNYFKSNPNNTFPDALVTSFLKTSNNEIWITTYGGGVVECDSNLNIKHVFTNGNGNAFPFAPGNEFWSLAEDEAKNIWIGGQSGSLSVYNTQTKQFANTSLFQAHYKTIRIMRTDASHNIYLGLQNGNVIEWNNTNKKFISFDSVLRAHNFLGAACNDILVDADNTIWVANDHYGLLKMNADTHSAEQFIPGMNDNNADSTVICINNFSKNILSVGTMNNGVYLFNTLNKTFKRLQPLNGYFNAFVTGISTPVNQHIWIATYSSISSFDLNKSKLTNYSKEDGLASNVYTSKIFLINKKLFAGNDAGFTLIDPSELETAKPGKVFITGISVFNKPLHIDSLLQHNSPLHLSYKQNFLTISFASPAFFQTHALSYSYKLEGVDPGWNTTSNPEVNYTELKGGTYTFNVYCENENNEHGAVTQFSITIQPPFWQTNLFYALLAIFVFALITLFYYYRLQQIKKKERERNKTERQLQEMKLTILRTQLNPHFMFNSLNAIHTFILSNSQEEAVIYLSKFAKLMRMVLDTSQQNFIPLHEEIEMLNLYIELENLRLNNSIEYSIQTPLDINIVETIVPPLLMQPCIENAIWHGLTYKKENRKLSFTLKQENNFLFFELEDNGIGRQLAAEIKNGRTVKHKSKGILLVEERLLLAGKQMNAESSIKITDLFDNDGNAAGTRVVVCLPLIKRSDYDGK